MSGSSIDLNEANETGGGGDTNWVSHPATIGYSRQGTSHTAVAPETNSGMNAGTPGDGLEQLNSFGTGSDQNPTAAQSAPTSRAEQQGGGSSATDGANVNKPITNDAGQKDPITGTPPAPNGPPVKLPNPGLAGGWTGSPPGPASGGDDDDDDDTASPGPGGFSSPNVDPLTLPGMLAPLGQGSQAQSPTTGPADGSQVDPAQPDPDGDEIIGADDPGDTSWGDDAGDGQGGGPVGGGAVGGIGSGAVGRVGGGAAGAGRGGAGGAGGGGAGGPAGGGAPAGLLGGLAGAAQWSWAVGSAGVLGVVQGAANTVNGVQDGLIGLANLPGVAYNYSVGRIPGAPLAQYIPSPDWSNNRVTAESPFEHQAGKFLGGTGVTMLIPGAQFGVATGSLGKVSMLAQTTGGAFATTTRTVAIFGARTVAVAAPGAAVAAEMAIGNVVQMAAGAPGGNDPQSDGPSVPRTPEVEAELAQLKQAAAESAENVKRYQSRLKEIEQGLQELRDGTRTAQPGVPFDPAMMAEQFYDYYSQLLTKEQAVLDGHLKQIGKLLGL